MRWFVNENLLSLRQRLALDAMRNQLQRYHWLQGFAGTGKSLILVHLMKQLASLYPAAKLSFITFTNTLANLVATTPAAAELNNQVVVQTHTAFVKERKKYDFVFLDEVQDIRQSHLAIIRGLSGVLFVAGDFDQKIYDADISAEQILSLLNPEVHALKEVFRLTRRLCEAALAILPESGLVEGSPTNTNADVTINLAQARSLDEECAWVWREAARRARPADPSVVLFPNHEMLHDFACFAARSSGMFSPPKPRRLGGRRDYTDFNLHFARGRAPLTFLGNGFGSLTDSDNAPLVYLMTMHSAKGLDFKNVFIPFLAEDAKLVGAKVLAQDPARDRRLLFVAVTRSRENLFLSYSGERPHPLVANLPGVVKIKLADNPSTTVDADEEDYF
ncbi:MAG: ATP-binding domain-containing protein [Deltaproteobacteria bacterium]|jgi:superfamily I DNA/RNA helicase|nr:ATP-binding domain-containing protein [Deltaproteobacteria bacterium]